MKFLKLLSNKLAVDCFLDERFKISTGMGLLIKYNDEKSVFEMSDDEGNEIKLQWSDFWEIKKQFEDLSSLTLEDMEG